MSDHSAKPAWFTALGKIPSGLFIITTNSPQGETGFLASWVQQCSFDPPQLTIAMNNERPIIGMMEPDAPLVINVIPEGGKALLAHFGKGFAPGEPAFEGLAIIRLPESAVILQAALAWIATRVVRAIPAGDHTLVIAEVVGGGMLQDGKPTVHIRRDGSRY